MNDKPTVLFLCQHNAGRSQLGAHLLEYVAPGGFVADSAGISPADEINPVVAQALQEFGIDTSAARPRRVTEDDLATADVVVAMKPGLALPGPVGGRLIEWEFADPESWDLDGVRGLRDEILRAVQELDNNGSGGRAD
ncbi:low molecular weight phosphatase family protein [Microbacterium sp. CFBP9034]|uniref:arsenate-mycothiol transferase ArsC n=1 Tax=Microbacterium sp. CFBP9034 TaxID=3096540 RepID=UPI002A6B786A|nr:low molecular weight phosphatase family protein [Microbacterium sp. CFBP9034]MDY0910711.1 low molecular weight phosphatase family protein [Microbacterium sp. CFBP9034]